MTQIKRAFLGLSGALGDRIDTQLGPQVERIRGRRCSHFHGHEGTSLWFAIRGTVVIATGEAEVVLPPRQLTLLRDVPVAVQLDGAAAAVGLALNSQQVDEQIRRLSGASAGRRRMLFPTHGLPLRPVVGDLFSMLRQGRAHPKSARSAAERLPDGWVGEFLVSLAANQQDVLHPQIERSPGRTHIDRCRSFRRLMLARNFLRLDGGERLSVGQLAALACYSPSQFVRAFSNVFDETPGDARQRLRLNRAKRLLATTRLSVDEVADEIGYENRSAFSRMFRAETGCSATEFRLRAVNQTTELARVA